MLFLVKINEQVGMLFLGKNVELQGRNKQEPLSLWNWKFSVTLYLAIFSTLHDKCRS